ncbi:MAG: flagellar protein [Lachnospiraceae bacterium]|nr:flagellar protein [Lachnospiraceae bacterium]
MDVRNCRNCGRMFNYLGGPAICPICRDLAEKDFEKVRDYIRENPHANIQQISDDCEVTVQQINQWVREERLEFSKDSPIMLECENCGDPIRTGRYCEKCKNSMANNLTSAFKKPEAPALEPRKQHESDKMRFKR